MFLVGWKKGANSIYYPNSASNTRTVGAEISLSVNRLMDEAKLSRDKLWCVGFSLGAHVCGFAGMGTKFERITGTVKYISNFTVVKHTS